MSNLFYYPYNEREKGLPTDFTIPNMTDVTENTDIKKLVETSTGVNVGKLLNENTIEVAHNTITDAIMNKMNDSTFRNQMGDLANIISTVGSKTAPGRYLGIAAKGFELLDGLDGYGDRDEPGDPDGKPNDTKRDTIAKPKRKKPKVKARSTTGKPGRRRIRGSR